MIGGSIILPGIDGGNPLGFLAALGTLRTLSLAWPTADVRMSWSLRTAWQPVLHVGKQVGEQDIAEALDEKLREMDGHPAWGLGPDLRVSPEAFREYACSAAEAAQDTGDRRWADFVAAFGCEATVNGDIIQDTEMRTVGGGQQRFLQFMATLAGCTTREHLEAALFHPWRYDDPGPSMRWDPTDDRRYALRWKNPSGDSPRTVRGANRLAIEGLPLLPTMPVGRKLRTTGFTGSGAADTYWTWPIWTAPVAVDCIRSLLGRCELQQASVPRAALARIGIAEVYRSQRITVMKYRNFTPARAV